MAEVHLTKLQGGHLCAASQQDYELMRSWRVGDVVKTKMSKPRNGKHHRKAFALFNFIFENQDKYKSLEDLLVEIKLKAGHYKEHITTKGEMIYVPKSISFSKMEQDEFDVFYNKSIDIALQHFMQGMSEHQIRAHVEGVMGFTG